MGKLLKGLLYVAGALLVIALLARLLLVDVWTVPPDPVLGASVMPTLADGDTVLMLTRGSPGFGDLVRCPDPEEPTRFVVGRIVGEGGDRIEVDQNIVRVNGTRYHSTDACPEPLVFFHHPSSGAETELSCSRVDMGGSWHYVGLPPGGTQQSKVTAEVPAGYVYLLSDNREFHDDSRDFGALPAETCDHVIFFRLWGLEGFKDDKTRLMAIH